MSNPSRGKIIFVGSSKGGVAKTTLTESLSVEFAERGYKVVLVDADHKQKTLSKWADRRNEAIEQGKDWPYIPCFIKSGRIKNDLVELAKSYDIVLVDTAGRDSAELRSALLVADVVYVPARVSQHDLEALEELEETLTDTEELNPNRKVVGLVVCTPTHPSSTEKKDAKEFMSEFSDVMSLSKHGTSERKAYRVAPVDGASVTEWSDRKAKAEIQLIAQEIISYANIK